jgi:hypothetical protein
LFSSKPFFLFQWEKKKRKGTKWHVHFLRSFVHFHSHRPCNFYTGSTFLLGSHEIARICTVFFFLSFEGGFCFKCRRATRGGFVKSRRAHQKEKRKNSLVFYYPPVDVSKKK